MVKKYFAKDIEKISSDKLKSMIGKIKVRKEPETYEELAGSGLKKYMKEIARGGKTLTSIEHRLKTSGVVMSQAGKRQKLLKMVGGERLSSNQLKKMERTERRRKASLARQARASAELIEGRQDPLHKVFRGQKTETSEHIGVARQTGEASALTGQIANNNNRTSAQAVSVGATIGEAAGINPHAQGDNDTQTHGLIPQNDNAHVPSGSTGAEEARGLTSGVGIKPLDRGQPAPPVPNAIAGHSPQTPMNLSPVPGISGSSANPRIARASDMGNSPNLSKPPLSDRSDNNRIYGSPPTVRPGTPPANLPIGTGR